MAPPARGFSGVGVGIFLLPVALCVLGMAPLAKLAFLGCAALGSLLLAGRRPAAYVSFVLWLVILTPGLRHFVDWYAGFSLTNPMMLAPYCAMLAGSPACALHVLNRAPHSAVCAAMVVTIAVGAWMSLLNGAVQPPLLAAVRWLCPVLFATYIWANAAALPEVRASVIRVMRVALPAVAAYGLVQFVSILPWDAHFMDEAPINSIGFPVPFGVRVFSTMNSPGSLAALLSTGILLLLPRIRGIEFPSILLACCALFLTTQRAALGALSLAILVLALASRSGQVRVGLLKLCVAAAIAVSAAAVVPEAGKKLAGSLDSVTQLDQDNSAQERLDQYAQLSARLDARPFGSGLAWATNPNLLEGGKEAALDSGLIDILVSFGIAGGLGFLAMLGVLLARGWTVASRSRDPQAMAEFGVAVFGLSQLPFAGQHAGEHGVFLYLGLGLLLARACPAPGAASFPAAAGRSSGLSGAALAGPARPPAFQRRAGAGGVART